MTGARHISMVEWQRPEGVLTTLKNNPRKIQEQIDISQCAQQGWATHLKTMLTPPEVDSSTVGRWMETEQTKESRLIDLLHTPGWVVGPYQRGID